jgi:lipopolysaccharide export system protein LptA
MHASIFRFGRRRGAFDIVRKVFQREKLRAIGTALTWQLTVAVLLLGLATNAGAGQLPVLDIGAGGPIRIEADRMESMQQEEAVVFVGNVEAMQEGLSIEADEMTVYYVPSEGDEAVPGAENKKIRKLRARGNVRLSREGWSASGDAVEFLSEERQVILTGNTTVRQNDNTVSGDRIILYLDEGRSVVEQDAGGQERVKGVFYPDAAQ